jgi:predicted RNase H-like HicB family nuclease
MKPLRIPLHVVFYQEDGSWIAHCLEFDLMGDGETKLEALESLNEAIRLQVEHSLEHNNPRNLFTPANGRYFEMFARGDDVAVGKLEINFDSIVIDRTETREYLDQNLVGA